MGLWLFVGFLIGAILVFLMMQQRVSQQAKALKHNQMRLEQIEREHEHRMRSATLQLQEDYGRRLAEQKGSYERLLAEQKALSEAKSDQQAAEIEREYSARIRLLEQALGSSTQADASRGGEAVSSNPSALPGTPEGSAFSPLSAASQSSPTSDSVPAVLPTAIAPDRVKQPLPHTHSQSQIPPGLTQAETPLATLTANSRQIDPCTRKQAATALGEFVTGNQRAAAQRAIPILGKLIQDPDPSVRQAAVHSLGRMRAAQVIPLLKRALRDTDSEVVKTASTALSQFKGGLFKTSQSTTRKKLPRNR